jgi:hypothetical protein
VYRSRKAILMTFVITFGLLFTGLILETVFGYKKVFESHPSSYAFALLVGGFILSSLTFNDLGNSLRRYNYLILPASTLEKFLSMWFLTCICWIVVFTITFIVYSLIANTIGHLLFRNMTYLAFVPLGRVPLGAIKFYIVLQGIFLIGAVNFRGYVFPKTILTLLLFGLVCGIIFYCVMTGLFHSDSEILAEYKPPKGTAGYQLWQVIIWLFWWVLPPLCWVITYLGLKEQEV